MELRPYQEIAVQKGVDYFSSKSDKPSIIVAPTAYGKSIVISSVANRLSGKTIVLQPSKELLEQNIGKLFALGGTASIYSASLGQKNFGNITYATIGSIKSLGRVFREMGYTNVIVDECHLYPPSADSMFGGFIKELGVNKVLGFTATPFRLQSYSNSIGGSYSQLNVLTGRAKGTGFWKELIHVHQIKTIVDDGYWSKLNYAIYDFDTSDLRYNSTGAEFTDQSVERAYKNNDITNKILEFLKESERKSILIFTPTVAEAKQLSSNIPNSAVVYGDMDKKEREFTISSFRQGRIRVVVNVNVLSVGFDYPDIDCIILARPTASLAWLYQAIGRGTRISQNKKDCLIVDFVGNITKFGRIEELDVKKLGQKWVVVGSGRVLTGIPIDQIGLIKEPISKPEVEVPDDGIIRFKFGKHQGKPVSEAPVSYLEWMMKEFDWKPYQNELKNEISRVLNNHKTLILK